MEVGSSVALVYDRIRFLMKTGLLLVSILPLGGTRATLKPLVPAARPRRNNSKQPSSPRHKVIWSTASNHYRAAMQAAPSCVEAAVNLGVIYNRLNQSEEAIKTFKEALAKNPQLFPAHLNLGITYFRTTRTISRKSRSAMR